MASGKWLEGLSATTATADAARRVLSVRLGVVHDYLPLAVQAAEKDPEHVHQLRVGTRRARAALDIFACCLPAKVYRAAKKQLRDVRRAGGQARDWDVFLAGLTKREHRQNRRHRAGLDLLIGFALAQRVAAQEGLAKAAGQDLSAFDRLLTDTVGAVQPPAAADLQTLTDLARPQLAGLLRELEDAAGEDLDNYDHLHRVRIVGKRLRYAMEVFASCFGQHFREVLYPAVEEMQEILGSANDSHVAMGRLEALRAQLQARLPEDWRRWQPGLEGLLRHHRKRLPRERERFGDWWNQWRQGGSAAAFLAALKPAGQTVA